MYPVLDLVVCHGDFLNADHDYIHKNRSVKGFGSYGGFLSGNRKRYIAPTPFSLTVGVAHNRTLILPADFPTDSRFRSVGELVREEPEQLIVGYAFVRRANTMLPELVRNPAAGAKRFFRAYRLKDAPGDQVSMRAVEIQDEESSESITRPATTHRFQMIQNVSAWNPVRFVSQKLAS